MKIVCTIPNYSCCIEYTDKLSFEHAKKNMLRLQKQIERLLSKGFEPTDIYIESLHMVGEIQETVMVRYRSGWREFEEGE